MTTSPRSRWGPPALFALLALLAALIVPGVARAGTNEWPRRVLLTNDDGIDHPGIVALAEAFSRVADTYVVAPLEDRSGAGSFMSLGSHKPIAEIERRSMGPGIVAYGLDGYPADCVVFAVLGLMADDPPDLVVSGINGGPNVGADWFGSGTVGAARTAAFGGVPALAVSGLLQDDAEAVAAAARWVVSLAQSAVVRDLEPGQYLTVSIPRVPAAEIKGVRVAPRARLDPTAFVHFEPTGEPGPRITWQMMPPHADYSVREGDVELFREQFIVVVPMKVDESDYQLVKKLQARPKDIPKWTFKGGSQ
jgi:5'-nucleotidase